MKLHGQRVLVMGLARSGQAAARLAHKAGARVVAIDLRTGLDPIDGVVLELGPHRPERFDEADVIVVSPGIPAAHPALVAAMAAGKDVVGELGFALRFLDQPVIAITGTNGKSTTTHFAGQLLHAAGRRPFVGGNLGTPLCEAALGHEPYDVLVLEVSSYQLELPSTLRPRAGVILNLTPDHLERHGTMAAYARVKGRLFAHCEPTDLAVLPLADARLHEAVAGTRGSLAHIGGLPGMVRDADKLCLGLPGEETPVILSLAGFAVPGSHNRDNAGVAALLALAVGAAPAQLQAGLSTLRPLAHRMAIVADYGDVQWIDDSKATNLDATQVGVSGIDRSCVVLLGGQGKPLPDGSLGFTALGPVLARHRAVVTFGRDGPRIATELRAAGLVPVEVDSLEQAVSAGGELARPGDAVLLSPGCASFDAFRDFEHRGEAFAECVHRRVQAREAP